ncbi:MAG: polysaccharide deacetylase family protein [Planctomycetia bacterium]
MILMYHHVCPAGCVPAESAALEGWGYRISPEDFRRQLLWFQQRGWKYVSLEQYIAFFADPHQQNARHIAVTFDDGWIDNFQYALPVLTDLKIPATIFVVSGEMSGVSPLRRMSERQLQQLADVEIEVGAHTRTHPNLPTLSDQALREELSGARQDLEQVINRPVRYLAYPGGRFDRRVVDFVKEAGYEAACSVIGCGQNSERSRYWLYRDVFTEAMDSLKDSVKTHPRLRNLLHWRASLNARRRLAGK